METSLTVAEFREYYPEVVIHLVLWPLYYLFVQLIVEIVIKKLVLFPIHENSTEQEINNAQGLTFLFTWAVELILFAFAAIVVPSCLYSFKYKYLPYPVTGELNEDGFSVSEFRHYYPKVVAALVLVPLTPVLLLLCTFICVFCNFSLGITFFSALLAYLPYIAAAVSIGLYCHEFCYWGLPIKTRSARPKPVSQRSDGRKNATLSDESQKSRRIKDRDVVVVSPPSADYYNVTGVGHFPVNSGNFTLENGHYAHNGNYTLQSCALGTKTYGAAYSFSAAFLVLAVIFY